MTNPAERNRLDEEGSPYLEAHADNPVNWQPWDETAMQAARDQDKPVFLSIGYAACHWCHVMAEESFEDEAVAEVLNDHFIPVKVDREERPDIDSIYMTICQQVTGRGGWPLSAWLTPDGRPFYVGTYFPKEAKRGQPGFVQLLADIRDSWTDPEEREEIEDRADQWQSAVEGELEEVPDQPGEAPGSDAIEMGAEAAVRGADREEGGWGRGQKFPQNGRLHILMRACARGGREEYLDVVTETLDAMASGGLYDHVGGGFHRYTTDRDWTVPHFEKMLYDNAEIPRAFLAGYQVTGDERYAEVVGETFEFLKRELQHPDGGFYSTLDARSAVEPTGSDRDTGRGAKRPESSEGETGDQKEGAFYVWTPDEIYGVVDDETAADLFCDRYGVVRGGNFEKGQTVLTETTSTEELAEEYDMDPANVEAEVATAREQVFEARSERSSLRTNTGTWLPTRFRLSASTCGTKPGGNSCGGSRAARRKSTATSRTTRSLGKGRWTCTRPPGRCPTWNLRLIWLAPSKRGSGTPRPAHCISHRPAANRSSPDHRRSATSRPRRARASRPNCCSRCHSSPTTTGSRTSPPESSRRTRRKSTPTRSSTPR